MVKAIFILILTLGMCLGSDAQTLNSTKTAQEQPEITYSYYTIVVASFSLAENAKKFANTVKAKGYEPYFRKAENGYFRVCVYRLKTQVEAETRLEKMKHIDSIFQKTWVLGYDQISDNLTSDQL